MCCGGGIPASSGSDPGRAQSVLVTGASGVVGPHLCRRLNMDGMLIGTLGRGRVADSPTIVADLVRPSELVIDGRFDILVHTAPLWLLPDNLERFAACGIHRIIAFSSTSVETKKHSEHFYDQKLAQRLYAAEQDTGAAAEKLGIRLTVLRPTMIYGFGRDRNIMVIARLARRFGFFPVAGSGKGLRQPVHVLDLVEAVAGCMNASSTVGKSYNLGGAEKLTYKAMVQRIFRALGRTPRILHLPAPAYGALIETGLKLNVISGLSSAAATRMDEDLCFDSAPAQRDFGYSASAFLENPARDLPF